MKNGIVVVGSSNMDLVVHVDKLPSKGETVTGGKFFTAHGGKGANQAVAAARCGAPVSFISCVGKDSYGHKSVTEYKKDHINTSHIFFDEHNPTGVACIFVGSNGENCIAVAPGANASLTPKHIDQSANIIKSARVLMMQLETPMETISKALEIGHKNVLITILNPAPVCDIPDEILKKVMIISPNETEAEQLTGVKVVDEHSAKIAANRLLKKGVSIVLITLGEKGAFYAGSGLYKFIPAFKVDAIDTTGAGDAFHGGLAYALLHGYQFEEAIVYGNAVAALSVTKIGAQTSFPHKNEISAFLDKNLKG